MTDPPRSFAVDNHGSVTALSVEERVSLMGISPDVSAAYDLLTDAGVPAERAASLSMAAHRDGRDAEQFARHFLKLRRAAQDPT